MKKSNVIHVVGARPNFMKLAPVYEALATYKNINQYIIHTGQHYDHNMSDIFFEQFNIPSPNENLNISGKSALQQIGYGIIKLEQELPKYKADLVLIYGDVNATAYCSIVCSKLGIKVAHIEAGLRSFDNAMPEETNRIIADSLSDYFFTHSKDANVNLLDAGIKKDKIFFVGNVMIDTLIKFLPKAEEITFNFQLPPEYALVTLHRPSNVDDENKLAAILNTLNEIGSTCPLIFPLHPRTLKKISAKMKSTLINIILTEPFGYIQFLKLQKNAKFIITDSGGIQEESTWLGVPCFTLRNNTERPVTVKEGTNILVGTDIYNLKKQVNIFLRGKIKKAFIPALWDGKASVRIAKHIDKILSKN